MECNVILASASPRRKELLRQIGWEFEICVSQVEEHITATEAAEVVEELSSQKAWEVYGRRVSVGMTREGNADGGNQVSEPKAHGRDADSQERETVFREKEMDSWGRETVPREKEMDSRKRETVLRERVRNTLVIGADTVVSCDGRILGKPRSREDAFAMLRLLQGRSHHVYTGVTLILGNGMGEPVSCTFHEETEVCFYPMTDEEIESYLETGEPFDKAGAYGIQGQCARYIRGIQGDYGNVVGLPVGRLYQEAKRLCREADALSPEPDKPCREADVSSSEPDKPYQEASEPLPAGTTKKAVIFDLDGTLSDSIASIKYCGDLAMEPYGYGPYSIGQYKYFVGDGAANLVKRCLAAGGDEDLVHFQEAYARYREIFRENCMYEVKPYEGIPELLKELKQWGIRIAVLSNKPHQETVRVIETLFGRGCFDVIQGQEPGIAIKPSPEGGLRVLRRLGLQPREALYLGDTATDMRTGKALGAYTLGVLWGFRERKELEEGGADAVIAHPLEALEYL